MPLSPPIVPFQKTLYFTVYLHFAHAALARGWEWQSESFNPLHAVPWAMSVGAIRVMEVTPTLTLNQALLFNSHTRMRMRMRMRMHMRIHICICICICIQVLNQGANSQTCDMCCSSLSWQTELKSTRLSYKMCGSKCGTEHAMKVNGW